MFENVPKSFKAKTKLNIDLKIFNYVLNSHVIRIPSTTATINVFFFFLKTIRCQL